MVGLLWMGPAIAQTTFTRRDESPEEFSAGTGRDETFYACTACHGFAQQGMTRAQWEDSINLMSAATTCRHWTTRTARSC